MLQNQDCKTCPAVKSESCCKSAHIWHIAHRAPSMSHLSFILKPQVRQMQMQRCAIGGNHQDSFEPKRHHLMKHDDTMKGWRSQASFDLQFGVQIDIRVAIWGSAAGQVFIPKPSADFEQDFCDTSTEAHWTRSSLAISSYEDRDKTRHWTCCIASFKRFQADTNSNGPQDITKSESWIG